MNFRRSPLTTALLLSLLAHGALLAWGRWQSLPARTAPLAGVSVSLRQGLAGEGARVRPTMPQPVMPAAPLTRKVEQPPVLAVPAPSSSAVATTVRPAEGPASRHENPAEGSGRAPGNAAAAAGTESGERGGTGAPRESVSGDALRQFRLALALEARRFKRYPRLARERGWEGTVEVVVVLGAAGGSASLQRSSGYAQLDEQGVEMLNRALAATPVPEALRGREWRLVLPVQFSLEE